jgi:hypothetical protein
MLQKSPNAVPLNFREIKKQAETVDRCSAKRAIEVTGEFGTQ